MKNRVEIIEAFLSELSIDVDVLYFCKNEIKDMADLSGAEIYERVEEIIRDAGGFDIEIIYYSEAMKFLTEHDNSLNRSMSLASQMCYELENINSELLASLLATEIISEEWADLVSDFEELDDLLEDE